jgi:hypothetical protein
MARRTISITALILVFCALPVLATTIYDNGPANASTVPVYSISGIDPQHQTLNWVADTFTIAAGGAELGKVQLALWFPTGDAISALDFTIWNLANCHTNSGVAPSCSGTPVIGTTTASLSDIGNVGSNSTFGFTLDQFLFALPQVALGSGTYWLQLQNAQVSNSGMAYWDSNGGAGCTGNNGAGAGCASGALWLESVNSLASQALSDGNKSESFAIIAAPEPGTLTIVGAGLLALAALRRRKR